MIVKGEVLRRRDLTGPLGTPGALVLENGFRCDSLELEWANNARGKSCILPGPSDAEPQTYRGRVWWSPTLERLVIRYEDKNQRKDCLVHNGNFAARTADLDGDGVAEVTQVHGCTEVGRGYGEILRKDGRKQWGIKVSGPTLADLVASLRMPGVDVIRDAEGYVSGYHEVEVTYRWVDNA